MFFCGWFGSTGLGNGAGLAFPLGCSFREVFTGTSISAPHPHGHLRIITLSGRGGSGPFPLTGAMGGCGPLLS